MSEVNTDLVVEKTIKDSSETDVGQKRWFYVAQLPGGAISKGSADAPSGFMEMLGKANIAWVDYVTNDTSIDKEAVAAAVQLGFSEQLLSSFCGKSYTNYLDFDTEVGVKLPSIQVRLSHVEPYPLLLLMKRNFILTVHPVNVDRRFTKLRRYSETVLKKIPVNAIAEDKMTLLLARIIDENNDRNFEHLRQIEEKGDALNEALMDPHMPRTKIAPEIVQMKHALITYLNALWDTLDVLHALRYGDAELITNEPVLLEKLGLLAEDVNRQIGLAEHMSEVLASGLEVLSSIYNAQLQSLNNRMALFMTYLTIIGTAVLVPNTLATILGNAVFEIGPQDMGWYLALMIGSTALATVGVYFWVKKSKWIPNKIDSIE